MAADKDEIKLRSDVVDVIGAFVPLKKRGRNHIGLCPFHQEKTPSFNVDPATQTFKCFGCGVGGDIFTFIEQYQNMSFVEAAEFLARRAGLTFERARGQSPEQISERERMLALNEMAAKFFEDRIQRVESAKHYLLNRGVSYDTIRQFRLGFAPEGWDNLAGHLQAQKQDVKLAIEAGLLHRGQTGDVYDVFRNRIVFPILDEQERIVGFGGRTMGEDQPKYLNTGETPLFSKSKLLYGLSFARRKIASEERALLMEGYTDVIAAHQAGFNHAVATLGTSLTEEHARKLARLAPTVVLVYDADNAGIKATLRASEILEKEGVQVRVVRLPAGEDPDSILSKGDIAGFQAALDTAAGRVEYQLERIVQDVGDKDDGARQLMMRQIVEILASVPTRVERDVYINKVWRFHPMSGHGPSVASEQLHADAEARAAQKRGEQPAKRQAVSQPYGQNYGYQRRERPWSEQSDGRRRDRGSFGRDRFPYRLGPVEPPPKIEAGPTSEDRAEQQLLRALAEPEWRSTVLRYIRPDELCTEDGRRFARFVETNLAELNSAEEGWAAVLDRREEAEFSLRIRQHLQEIGANSAKVPVNEAGIKGCAETIKRHREIELVQRQYELLQSKPVLSAEDQERVREYQIDLRKLKGSNPSAGVQGE